MRLILCFGVHAVSTSRLMWFISAWGLGPMPFSQVDAAIFSFGAQAVHRSIDVVHIRLGFGVYAVSTGRLMWVKYF